MTGPAARRRWDLVLGWWRFPNWRMGGRRTNSTGSIKNFKGLVAEDYLKSKEWGLGPPGEHKELCACQPGQRVRGH